MKGARLTEIREETGPPDMYYDPANNKQTQTSPETLQTIQKNIPLTTTQSVQDVRFLESGKRGISQSALHVDIAFPEDQVTQMSLPTLVVTRGGAKTIPPPYPYQNDDVSSKSSPVEDTPHVLATYMRRKK